MLALVLALLGLGGVALLARSDAAAAVAAASPPMATPDYEFPPEVITHSPEFLVREATARQAQEAGKVDATRKVLFLGDSLTAGGYWRQVKLPDATVAGHGWAGQGVKKILAEALPLVDKERPTDIVLLAGVNGVASQHGAARVKADLTAAWAALKGTGARVWAVKLTPWFGYKFKKTKHHAAGPISDGMKAVTREVNGWLQSVAGTADGPDHVIDASALGDADYKLRAEYSHDGLHMSRRGYTALALLVQAALAGAPARVGLAPLVDCVARGELIARVAQVGLDITATTEPSPDMRAAIAQMVERLTRNDAAPAAVAYEYDPRARYHYAVFGFHTAFRADRAAELLRGGTKVGAQYLYVKTRVLPEAEVGAARVPAHAVPAWLAPRAGEVVDRLAAHDAAPARVTYDDASSTLTLWFYTDLRARRAREVVGLTELALRHWVALAVALLPEAEIGQVVGTAQETPWTCGPAALRAVLAHHGDDVDEDTLAVLAGNVPVLGVRPSGLVKAATELGYHVSAFQAAGVAALAPLLARDLPVLAVVDSFTQPGRAGHWVVVTALGPGGVTLMDPHAPGNWRTLTPAAFDARWWHREGGRVARRLAVVVAPAARVTDNAAHGARWHADHVSRNDALAGEVGAEPEATPAHGRTARLVYKGMPGWLNVLGKVQRGATKALVTMFSGGTLARAWDAAQDQLMGAVGKLDGKAFATWINNAPNEEVAALRMGQLRKQVTRARAKHDKKIIPVYDRLGLTDAALAGPVDEALEATFRAELFSYGLAPLLPPQLQLHSLQAMAILLYGGADVLPLLDALLARAPAVKDWQRDPGLAARLAWVDDALATLGKTVEAPKEFA